MQHVLARHDAEPAACVQASPVKVKALHRQRARTQRRDIAEHAEECHAQRVNKRAVRLFVVDDDEAQHRFHRLVGKAECEQEQHTPERHSTQVLDDIGQHVAENKDDGNKDQRQRETADEIGSAPFAFQCCSSPPSQIML